MDNVIKQCNQLQQKLIAKYNLEGEQKIAFERAIATYDYLQNEGVIFTCLDILECFKYDEEPIAPNMDTIFALCEYIIKTIQFYELVYSKSAFTIKTNADIRAKEIIGSDNMWILETDQIRKEVK